MERLSIAIPSDVKKQLGLMAKANFRNLNGEINKALDDYIRKNGVSVVENAPNWWENESEENKVDASREVLEPHRLQEEPIRFHPHQTAPQVHQKAPIITTLHNNDEIEEF